MSRYEECLALATEQGLFLDPRIERRQENGVYGMYATTEIPKGTVIASFPRSAMLKDPNDDRLQDPNTKWSYVIACDLAKGDDAEYKAHTMMMEDMEQLKQHSLLFFPQEDLQTLHSMNPILGNAVTNYFHRVNQTIGTIKRIKPELEDEHIYQATLNVLSRAWGKLGILPVMDLFNHSEAKGVGLRSLEDEERVGFTLQEDYAPGQQVWITYGQQDVFSHAVNYNYFDPSNTHIIDYMNRAVQILDTPAKQEVAEFISQHYKASIFEYQGQKKMVLHEGGLFIHETHPSEKLVMYFSKTGFTTAQELKMKRCSPLSAGISYLSVINAFIGANRVDEFKLTKLPKRLHRFHQALKKEKRMLLANKAWAEQQVEKLKTATA